MVILIGFLLLITIIVSADDSGTASITWLGLNGLTARMEKGELVIDTKVLESDLDKRLAELKQNPDAPVWKKTEIKPEQEDDCIGSINGVRLWKLHLS